MCAGAQPRRLHAPATSATSRARATRRTAPAPTPNAPNGTACNDGNACTQTDTCQAGVCAGANPVVCTASDQCHVAGTCNPTTGVCSNPERAQRHGVQRRQRLHHRGRLPGRHLHGRPVDRHRICVRRAAAGADHARPRRQPVVHLQRGDPGRGRRGAHRAVERRGHVVPDRRRAADPPAGASTTSSTGADGNLWFTGRAPACLRPAHHRHHQPGGGVHHARAPRLTRGRRSRWDRTQRVDGRLVPRRHRRRVWRRRRSRGRCRRVDDAARAGDGP